jgi:hypothetical protein
MAGKYIRVEDSGLIQGLRVQPSSTPGVLDPANA